LIRADELRRRGTEFGISRRQDFNFYQYETIADPFS